MDVFQLNHIAVHTDNLNGSVAFYRDVLKLIRIPRPGFKFDGAWFALSDDQELHIIAGRTDPVVSHSRGTHVALQIRSMPAAEKHLRACGQDYSGPQSRPDGATQIFVTDPDGHVIELTDLSTACADQRSL